LLGGRIVEAEILLSIGNVLSGRGYQYLHFRMRLL